MSKVGKIFLFSIMAFCLLLTIFYSWQTESIGRGFVMMWFWYSILVVPLITVMSFLWITILAIKWKKFSYYKVPLILFTIHLLLSAIFEEHSKWVNSDQFVTSSGDFGIQLSLQSKVIGYVIIILILISNFILIRKENITKWICVFLMTISLLVYYKNLQTIVCGTNGMRWYNFHFFWGTLPNDYIGSGPFDYLPADSLSDYWKPRIEKITLDGNNITFHRNKRTPYIIKRQFLFWQFDEEEIKSITRDYEGH